jgi:hypothetical protein
MVFADLTILPDFPYASKRTDILKMATQGIINKGLEVPESLKKFE